MRRHTSEAARFAEEARLSAGGPGNIGSSINSARFFPPTVIETGGAGGEGGRAEGSEDWGAVLACVCAESACPSSCCLFSWSWSGRFLGAMAEGETLKLGTPRDGGREGGRRGRDGLGKLCLRTDAGDIWRAG